MRGLAAALLIVSACWVQRPQETGPGWTAQQLEFWNMSGDLSQALKAINEKPRRSSETVMKEGTCGALLVYTTGPKDSKGNEVVKGIRTTFDGQKPEKIAFCWLNEVRRRFAAEETEAKGHSAIESFMKDVQLAFLTEPDSVYLRLVNVYCSNGGTLYTSLTGTALECPSAKGKPGGT